MITRWPYLFPTGSATRSRSQTEALRTFAHESTDDSMREQVERATKAMPS